MSLKSILRALGVVFGAPGPQVTDRAQMPLTDRLKGRSDWMHNPHTATPLPKADPFALARLIDPNFPNPPEWTRNVPPAPGTAAREIHDNAPARRRSNHWEENARAQSRFNTGHASDPWPATDDPYAKPEPCAVVTDPAFDNLKGVERVTDLIDRQEAAEKLLRIMGWEWDHNQKSWRAPIL
jgi:hypothetical protein